MTEVGTSYFGVRDPKAVRRDLDRLAGEELSGILHTFSERDLHYYTETMRQIINDSQERGFNVYVNPWGIGNVFGGEAVSQFIGEHPEATQQLSNGQRVPAACFNAPEFRDFMSDWVNKAISLGVDIIFWDEPHWYKSEYRLDKFSDNAWTCRCPHCREAYSQEFDETMPVEFSPQIDSFRNQSIVNFLKNMAHQTAQTDVQTAICLEPDPSYKVNSSRLENFGTIDDVDMLGITPFWELHGKAPAEFVGNWTEKTVDICDTYNLKSQVWIQGFNLKDTTEALQNFKTAIRSALNHAPDSLFLWGWDGCRIMSSIACDNPGMIWNTFLEET